jgi:hypothetical protein
MLVPPCRRGGTPRHSRWDAHGGLKVSLCARTAMVQGATARGIETPPSGEGRSASDQGKALRLPRRRLSGFLDTRPAPRSMISFVDARLLRGYPLVSHR